MSRRARQSEKVLIRCLVAPETRSALDEVAKRWGWTRSQLLREAIRAWLSTAPVLQDAPPAPPPALSRAEEGRWLTLERF